MNQVDRRHDQRMGALRQRSARDLPPTNIGSNGSSLFTDTKPSTELNCHHKADLPFSYHYVTHATLEFTIGGVTGSLTFDQ
ncbi:hypothetical protein AB0K68_53930 [Streptomyces sp. NPDC050698]